MADVSITKQAAAQRQIDAAIRMLFLHGEDLFVIQTVAAAARTIVSDLADAKGVGRLHETRRALEQQYRDAVAAAARSFETGSALEELHRDTLAAVAGYIARDAAAIGVTLAEINLAADVTDPKVAAAIDWRARAIESDKRTHKHRNKAANFLKHADKDADRSLILGELDVLWVIGDAINMWMNLDLPLTDEILVYSLWFFAVLPQQPQDFKQTKAGPAHLLTFEQQIGLGRHLLKAAHTKTGRSTEWFRDDAAHDVAQLAAGRMFTAL